MRRSDEETERKRARESRAVHEMIALYCRGIHHTAKGSLCPECEALDAYAQKRIARCPFMRTKTFCSVCLGALLCTQAAGRDPSGHALLRPPHPLPPSCHVRASRYRHARGEEAEPGEGQGIGRERRGLSSKREAVRLEPDCLSLMSACPCSLEGMPKSK